MATAKDVLRRLVVLLDSGKIQDSEIQGVLNGAVVNGQYVYTDGNLKGDAGVVPLSPDKIVSFKWPPKVEPVKPASGVSKMMSASKPSTKAGTSKPDKKN